MSVSAAQRALAAAVLVAVLAVSTAHGDIHEGGVRVGACGSDLPHVRDLERRAATVSLSYDRVENGSAGHAARRAQSGFVPIIEAEALGETAAIRITVRGRGVGALAVSNVALPPLAVCVCRVDGRWTGAQ